MMSGTSRRNFIALAATLGATAAWARTASFASRGGWKERRDLYPEGVASGDPETTSVVLWTRRPFQDGRRTAALFLEVAQHEDFSDVVATAQAPVSQGSDWTCRILVGGLKPREIYW